MKMRTFLAYLHLLNFLIGIFATGYVLTIFWNNLETWQTVLYFYYLVLGFCSVAIVYWIAWEGKNIEQGVDEIQDLQKRILELEKSINRIKTRALEKS